MCSVEAPAKHAAAGGGGGVDLGQCSSAGCMTGLRGRGAGAGPGRLQATPTPVVREIGHTGCPTTIYALRQGANGWPMNTATCRCARHCHSPPFRAPVVLAGYRHCVLELPLGNADAGPARVHMRPWCVMRLPAPWPWPQCAATRIATVLPSGGPRIRRSSHSRPGPAGQATRARPAEPKARARPGGPGAAGLWCGAELYWRCQLRRAMRQIQMHIS